MNVNDPSQSDGDVADFKLSSKERQDKTIATKSPTPTQSVNLSLLSLNPIEFSS